MSVNIFFLDHLRLTHQFQIRRGARGLTQNRNRRMVFKILRHHRVVPTTLMVNILPDLNHHLQIGIVGRRIRVVRLEILDRREKWPI